jgi:hypothetical protein
MSVTPEEIALPVGISFAITILIIIVTSWLFRRNGRKFDFLDIARDSAGYPSLARFQFLVWTIIILFGIFSINILRLYPSEQGQGSFTLQPGLLALMGISVAVTPTSSYVSKLKYGDPSGEVLDNQALMKERKEKKFASMLFESGRPSLTRFQMFSWTIISVSIYCAQLFNTFITVSPSNMTMPEVDPVMVMLMGLSQVAYVGGKWISPSGMFITNVYPLDDLKDKEIVTIAGTNFGMEAAGIEITKKIGEIVSTQRIDKEHLKWNDTKIEITITEKIDKISKIKLNVENREAKWPSENSA